MDTKSRIHLTNEEVVRKFKSSFDLVNYAIQLAENMISSGREARVDSDIQNRAMLILEEIHEGEDRFDEIEVTSVAHAHDAPRDVMSTKHMGHEKQADKRKFRSSDFDQDDE